MPDIAGSQSSVPTFEIVHERDVPKKPHAGFRFRVFGDLSGAVRAAIEDVYVTFAKGVMQRTEGLQDALAERRHIGRTRRIDKQLLRRRPAAPFQVGASAHRRTRS